MAHWYLRKRQEVLLDAVSLCDVQAATAAACNNFRLDVWLSLSKNFRKITCLIQFDVGSGSLSFIGKIKGKIVMVVLHLLMGAILAIIVSGYITHILSQRFSPDQEQAIIGVEWGR